MRLSARLARFLRDECGTVTIETLFMFPLLCWVLLATVVFFQGFHVQSLNVKVTYTIGDILSREDQPITPEYMDSIYALQAAMSGSNEARTLRVTAVAFKQDNPAAEGEYRVIWSQVRGTGALAHTDATLAAIADERLPRMSDGQVTILTETWQKHTPAFVNWVGIDPLTFDEIIATRPRAPQFCWNVSNNPADWTEASNACNI